MTTEPLKPMECAHRDLYAQNYPQFLWILSPPPHFMRDTPKKTNTEHS